MSTKAKLTALQAIVGSVILSLLVFLSCDTFEGELVPNQPPRVWLTSGPIEGGVSSSLVHFFWNGWDMDGDIRYFEYAITDNENGAFDPADTTGPDNWQRSNSLDKVFIFSADEIADTSSSDMITEFTRSHTFFIRAVDDKGLASPSPAYRSFTARTLSPTVDITFPEYLGLNPVTLPPVAMFYWTATDYIDDIQSQQEPKFVRWILISTKSFSDDFPATIEYVRENPSAPEWSDWQNYQAPHDEGKSLTTSPLDPGAYVFAVQAKDEAGAVTPVFDEMRNVRRVLISEEGFGPTITLCNDLLNLCWQSNGLHTPLSLVDLSHNTPLTFTLELTDYQPETSLAYCYGWDMNDLNDYSCAEWAPYPGQPVTVPIQTWLSGSHTFHVLARNEWGFKSLLGIKFNIIPFTMERNLLVIDDYSENPTTCGIENTNGAVPCDDEHDAFWMDVLQNVDGFVPEIDMIEVSRFNPLPIDKLAQYKNVIWNVRGGYNLLDQLYPHLYDHIKFRPHDPYEPGTGYNHPNLLAVFLAAGGHLLICGDQPMTMVINRNITRHRKFPLILKYELGQDQDGRYYDQLEDPVGIRSFAYRDMCLDVLDIAYPDYFSLRNMWDNDCGVDEIREYRPKEEGIRAAIPMDPNFPRLQLRPEVAGPGKHFAPESRGLNCDLYNPQYFSCGIYDLGPRDCFEPIYGHGCLAEYSPLYGSPVAVWTSTYADVVPDIDGGVAVAARSAVWGFEPFYFEPASVRLALEVILFNEWQLPSR
jgi:hypothetical protein